MTNVRAATVSLLLLILSAAFLITIPTSPVSNARQQQPPPAQNLNSAPRPVGSPCPYVVSVSAPAHAQAGDVITFTSDVDYSGQAALSYTWTLDPPEARVLSGEGTPTINVDTTGVTGGRITVTLIVDDGSGDPACRQRAEVTTKIARVAMTRSAPPPLGDPALDEPIVRSAPPTSIRPGPESGAPRRSARPAPQVAAPPDAGEREDFTRVRVFYGTDRNRTGAREPKKFYGARQGQLELGTCEVGIPKSHEKGHLESPSWWHLEFREDPKRHVMLRKVEPLDRAKFYEQYRAELGKAHSRDVFVFVHGFNVSFEDSARRTAQLAYDLGFPGVPVMYSWPSQGELSGYMVDEDIILATRTHLKQFLSDLSAQSQGAHIHLIAHSMGNRVMTDAMHDIALADPTPLFSEVILTAPDINATYFRNELAPVIQKIARRVTLYASSDDKALMASEKAHHSQRAGDSKPEIIVVPGIDTVDASGIDTSLLGLGHSYFAETKIVLDDINLLLIYGKPPSERPLSEQPLGDGRYWKFSPVTAAAAVGGVAPTGQGIQEPGATPRAGGFSLRLVLLLAVVLAACGVGAWLALRFARRKSA